jgi:hypothetical protein
MEKPRIIDIHREKGAVAGMDRPLLLARFPGRAAGLPGGPEITRPEGAR